MTLTKVTMFLGLNDAATEDNIVTEIKNIKDQAYQSDVAKIKAEKELDAANKVSKEKEDKLADEIAQMKKDLAVKEKEFEDAKNELAAMKKEKEDAENKTKEVSAKNMVEGFAKAGRIKNDAASITKWTNLAIKDGIDEVKAMIEELPLNKVAPSLQEEIKLKEGEMPTTAAGLTAKVMTNLKNQGRNI